MKLDAISLVQAKVRVHYKDIDTLIEAEQYAIKKLAVSNIFENESSYFHPKEKITKKKFRIYFKNTFGLDDHNEILTYDCKTLKCFISKLLQRMFMIDLQLDEKEARILAEKIYLDTIKGNEIVNSNIALLLLTALEITLPIS